MDNETAKNRLAPLEASRRVFGVTAQPLPFSFGSVPDLSSHGIGDDALIERGFADLAALAATAPTPAFLADSMLFAGPSKHAQPIMRRSLGGMLAAIGRMQRFPEGLGGRNGPGAAIAAAQMWLWRPGSGQAGANLMGENDIFDGASYTLMLHALGGRLPAGAVETAKHASAFHYATFDKLQKTGPIMRDCLKDREAIIFNLRKVAQAQVTYLEQRFPPPQFTLFDIF
jgi:hypothetical protein